MIPPLIGSEISFPNAAEENLKLGDSPAQIRPKEGVAIVQQNLSGEGCLSGETHLVQGVGGPILGCGKVCRPAIRQHCERFCHNPAQGANRV
jgi:hypothetical protein